MTTKQQHRIAHVRLLRRRAVAGAAALMIGAVGVVGAAGKSATSTADTGARASTGSTSSSSDASWAPAPVTSSQS